MILQRLAPFLASHMLCSADQKHHVHAVLPGARLLKSQACILCSGTPDGDCMCLWIGSLPEEVQLPLFQYSEADLEACQDSEVIREAMCIRESALSVYQVLMACGPCPAKLAGYLTQSVGRVGENRCSIIFISAGDLQEIHTSHIRMFLSETGRYNRSVFLVLVCTGHVQSVRGCCELCWTAAFT